MISEKSEVNFTSTGSNSFNIPRNESFGLAIYYVYERGPMVGGGGGLSHYIH
jgi:hypothetical protein